MKHEVKEFASSKYSLFQKCVLLSKNVQKPLVIHCRNSGNGEAANALNILKDSDAFKLQIHLQWFSGTIEELTCFYYNKSKF